MRFTAIMTSVLFFILLLASPSGAQVTGFPGINDYTVNGMVSGSTSCTLATIPPSTPMTFTITAAPLAPVVLIFVIPAPGSACACGPAYITFSPNTCVGTQSLDVPMYFPGCFTFLVFGTTDTSGLFTLPGPICTPGLRFSTQAVVFDPSCPPERVWTQAYDVGCL